MKIADKLAEPGHSFSFEFFPPKEEKSAQALLRAAERLRALEPAYVSVTWGAGGSTRRKTLDVVQMIKSRFGLESMAHLTCVGASKAEIDAILEDIDTRGIENVLALRGDPPQGDASFTSRIPTASPTPTSSWPASGRGGTSRSASRAIRRDTSSHRAWRPTSTI